MPTNPRAAGTGRAASDCWTAAVCTAGCCEGCCRQGEAASPLGAGKAVHAGCKAMSTAVLLLPPMHTSYGCEVASALDLSLQAQTQLLDAAAREAHASSVAALANRSLRRRILRHLHQACAASARARAVTALAVSRHRCRRLALVLRQLRHHATVSATLRRLALWRAQRSQRSVLAAWMLAVAGSR